MTRLESSEHRTQDRARRLPVWASEHDIDLSRFDEGQRWVLFAALHAMAFLGAVAPLRRVLGYLLAHCGMDLGGQVLAALVGVTDRAVHQTQNLSPEQLLHRVQHPVGGHRAPALEPHHAGPLAKYFVEHPEARVADILAFVQTALGVSIERHTLQNYVRRFGLGCLKAEALQASPPFWAEQDAEAPSS
jgi:hypothetical protein